MGRNGELCGLLVFLAMVHSALSGGTIILKLEKYDNPSKRNLAGHCCNGVDVMNDCPNGECHHSFNVCITAKHGHHVAEWKQTKLHENMAFSVPVLEEEYIVTINVTNVKSVGKQPLDIVQVTFLRDKPLASSTVNGTRTKNPTSLVISVSGHCDDNGYLANCSRICVDQDDCTGHYTCDKITGDRVCLDGWKDKTCTHLISGSSLDCATFPAVSTGSSVTSPTNTGTSNYERADLECSSGAMSIHVPFTVLQATHFVTLRDPNCTVINNGTHFVISVSLQKCGTTVAFTKDAVIFSNDLIATSTAVTSRRKIVDYGLASTDQRIHVTCQFSRRAMLEKQYLPTITKGMFYEKQYGHLDFEIKQFKTEQYATQIPNGNSNVGVPLNRELFISMEVDHNHNHPDIGIAVDSCIATPTPNPADPEWYALIRHGCPEHPEVRTFTSPNLNEFRFSFLVFRFTQFPGRRVYIHCQVLACPRGQCAPTCGHGAHRTRRSVSVEGQSQSHLISTGPFYLKEDKGSEGYTGGLVAGVVSVAALAVLVTMVALVAWRKAANELSKTQSC